MKLTPLKIAKAKQTRFGRLLCRLFGDERGAVMMEYVVLGVLLVAGVVAIVITFGDQLQGMFINMMDAMNKSPGEAISKKDERANKIDAKVKKADQHRKNMTHDDMDGK